MQDGVGKLALYIIAFGGGSNCTWLTAEVLLALQVYQ